MMRQHLHLLMAGSVLFLGLLLGPGIITAQPVDVRRQKLLKQLGADDYRARQQATHTLMAGDWLDDNQLRAMLDGAESLEKRSRLLTVAEHQTLRRYIERNFDQSDEGAVGVSHAPLPADESSGRNRSAVLVVATIPGFPGHSYLEPGDEIIAVAGEPFSDSASRNELRNELPRRITDRDRGDTIQMTVLRDGQEKTLRFPLSSTGALAAAHDPSTDSMTQPFMQAWLDRREQLTKGLDLVTPIKMQADREQ